MGGVQGAGQQLGQCHPDHDARRQHNEEIPHGPGEAGAAADVIVMDYKPFTPLSEENIDGHMLFGMMGKNCRTTIINGKVLYKDREFVGIDEEKINAWTMAESKKLWSTLNDRAY